MTAGYTLWNRMARRRLSRPVYAVAGGVSKFAKARKDKTFQAIVREAVDLMYADLGISFSDARDVFDGTVPSYFSDHFLRQLKGGTMVHDALGFVPKHNAGRLEAGGATGGENFQKAVREIASGDVDLVIVPGFETMSSVETAKGNEFIALASDTFFDFPAGGYYNGYYAMMAVRHMHELASTLRSFSKIAVKNHRNACFNPYAQEHYNLTLEGVLEEQNDPAMRIAFPLTRSHICTMSDGAAVVALASEEGLRMLERRGVKLPPLVKVTGIGNGGDAMRMADRPHEALPPLFPWEDASRYEKHGLWYPGIHSFRGARAACVGAYAMAGIEDPNKDLSVVELHDAYTSSELQTYEDMGLCAYGDGAEYVEEGYPFMRGIDYGFEVRKAGKGPVVNPSGGLLACGHPVGATGLMQAVFALWQLQQAIGTHFGAPTLQVQRARRGAIHSHAGTGTYIAVSILEREGK